MTSYDMLWLTFNDDSATGDGRDEMRAPAYGGSYVCPHCGVRCWTWYHLVVCSRKP